MFRHMFGCIKIPSASSNQKLWQLPMRKGKTWLDGSTAYLCPRDSLIIAIYVCTDVIRGSHHVCLEMQGYASFIFCDFYNTPIDVTTTTATGSLDELLVHSRDQVPKRNTGYIMRLILWGTMIYSS